MKEILTEEKMKKFEKRIKKYRQIFILILISFFLTNYLTHIFVDNSLVFFLELLSSLIVFEFLMDEILFKFGFFIPLEEVLGFPKINMFELTYYPADFIYFPDSQTKEDLKKFFFK